MKWVLIFLLIPTDGMVDTTEIGVYNTMRECFFAREESLIRMDVIDGIPPINTQLICVRTENK